MWRPSGIYIRTSSIFILHQWYEQLSEKNLYSITLQTILIFCAVIPTKKISKKKLNEDLSLIYKWLCTNRLSLNVDKTEFVVFKPSRFIITNRFTLKLNGTTLYESPKVKYLELILDITLSGKHHIFELRTSLLVLSEYYTKWEHYVVLKMS